MVNGILCLLFHYLITKQKRTQVPLPINAPINEVFDDLGNERYLSIFALNAIWSHMFLFNWVSLMQLCMQYDVPLPWNVSKHTKTHGLEMSS